MLFYLVHASRVRKPYDSIVPLHSERLLVGYFSCIWISLGNCFYANKRARSERRATQTNEKRTGWISYLACLLFNISHIRRHMCAYEHCKRMFCVERHKSVDNASTQTVCERKRARSGIFICVLYKNHLQQYESSRNQSSKYAQFAHKHTHTHIHSSCGWFYISTRHKIVLFIVIIVVRCYSSNQKNMATVFKCVE